MTDIVSLPASDHKHLVVLGVTHTWAFAAGTILLALRRHNPHHAADILLFHDKALSAKDHDLLEALGAHCQLFQDWSDCLTPELTALYSPLCLAKFHCFELLERYETILWLDADVIIQDSIEEVWDFGPFSMAREDVCFYDDHRPRGAKINGTSPLPGIDPDRPNLNSGVFVLNHRLPKPKEYARLCLDYMYAHKDLIRFADQAAFIMLAHSLLKLNPPLFTELPNRFNCHPRNPDALYAPIVHAFGAYKLWNDGLTAACFPEWQRDYKRWLDLGGSPWKGTVENTSYKDQGAFALLTSMFDTMTKSEKALKTLTRELTQEQAARKRLESLLDRFS